jgi:hypothetical protein
MSFLAELTSERLLTYKSAEDSEKKGPPKRQTFALGHPYGPAAKFRTPAEFALHLLWLISPSDDRKDCPCDWCPKYLAKEAEKKAAAAAAAQAAAARAQPPAPTPASAIKLPMPTAASTAVPTALPPTFSSTVFRQGELVWFKHQAWRLGIISRIDNPKKPVGAFDANSEAMSRYTILQLNHAALRSQEIPKAASDMRPFLTFSVPATTDEKLLDKSFDDVDWAMAVARAQQDPTNLAQRSQYLALEASKMAARKINFTYSLFNREASGSNNAEVRFGGVFLGAEQIREGDAVRLANNRLSAQGDTRTEVMRVERIYLAADGQLALYGNIYRLAPVQAQHNIQLTSAMIVRQAQEQLGSVFADEVVYRNSIADKLGRPLSQWEWVEQKTVRRETDVSGRFYATLRLLRIIEPATLEQANARGEIMDATAVLNSRLSSGGTYVGRKATRAAAVGQAVAQQLRLDGTIHEEA